MEEHGFPRPIVVRQPLHFKAYSQEQGFPTVLELMRQ